MTWPGRIPPVTDTKMIVAWNSLMISGLARAATVFSQPLYLQMATTAAEFILAHQWSENRLQRLNYDGQAAVAAQSEDYAFLIKALLDLHQAALTGGSGKPWLESARKVQEEFDQWFWSLEGGGYYNTATDASTELLVQERSWMDNATPSANGIAIANLVRLALLTEDLDYLAQAEQALKMFGTVMIKAPQGCPSLFTAQDWFYHHTLIRTTPDRVESLQPQYLPTAMFALEANLPPEAVGLVCQGLTCQEPAQNQAQLETQINRSQRRSCSAFS